ncbi:hypothetical protein [Roseinatronobacter domitianus]|uniref:hypothetical protein n=1 Tax=Roseinatronobacter domitianus TaxID=2940293 RepID=UPI0020117D04|nr:hypothetical protein [Roseibaca domitiana]
MLRSIGFIPGSLEEVVAFFVGEEIADMRGGALLSEFCADVRVAGSRVHGIHKCEQQRFSRS